MKREIKIVAIRDAYDIDGPQVLFYKTNLFNDEFEDFLAIARDIQNGGYISPEYGENTRRFIEEHLDSSMTYEEIIEILAKEQNAIFEHIEIEQWVW